MSFHLNQSIHNELTNSFLKKASPFYRDWEATTLFYTAVHMLNELFDQRGMQLPTSHGQRKRDILANFSILFNDYHLLFSLSMRSRYTAGTSISQTEVDNGITALDNLKSLIAQI